jgi:predicted enzyme related to lactoylglutathione lyase
MTTETNNGRFVWYEYMAKDTKQAIAFYSGIISWKTEPFPGVDDYTMWVGSQGPLGGVMALPAEVAKKGIPSHWVAHVQVAGVDATVASAQKLGGTVHHPPTDIPNVGRFAVIADPQGAAIAIFQSGNEMTLHDTAKPQEFCWNELITSDDAAGWKFYEALFGWKVFQDMDMGPMGTYRIFGIADKQLGGMMKTPPGAPIPPMWMFYVETENLEKSIDAAKAKGAQLLNGPMDVPGGRIAQFLDPQGAPFNLHQLQA